MIIELFLSCALAAPPAFVPPENHGFNVRIFKFIVDRYREENPVSYPKKTIYMMGGSDELLDQLLQFGLDTWRITMVPHHERDLQGSPDFIPVPAQSGVAAIYLWETGHDLAQAMKYFAVAAQTLCNGGLILFDEEFTPLFSRIAMGSNFYFVPLRWYDLEIWQKGRT